MGISFLRIILWNIVLLTLLTLAPIGCTYGRNDAGEIENLIRRYNVLVILGYRNQDMNPIQEVATEEHARRLYHHMSALGEGGLRMESRLKNIRFKKTDLRDNADATVETEETWDFAHYRMATNEKYAEEKDFIYRMGYILHKKEGRWIITEVNTIGGTSTNTVIPWPVPDRKGKPGKQQVGDIPSGHS